MAIVARRCSGRKGHDSRGLGDSALIHNLIGDKQIESLEGNMSIRSNTQNLHSIL